MDAYSSGEELVIKTRKPYTITKQRERWTEEEHNRFLEALKLYGRAWQRIEEHIGTKTAVQIRSHAQKFFSKLEKEALVKGVPVGQAIDIEIPPPRPKRKPSNPYPRKTGAVCLPNSQIRTKDGKQASSSSSQTTKQAVLDLEKEPPPEKFGGNNGKSSAKETCGAGHEGKCPEAFKLSHEGTSTLAATSANENSVTTMDTSREPCNLKEFVAMKKQLVNNGNNDSHATGGSNANHKSDNNPDNADTVQNDIESGAHSAKNFPRHAPVHIVDGTSGAGSNAPSSDVSYQDSAAFHHPMGMPGHPPLFSNPAVSAAAVESQNSSARSSSHHPMLPPSFHPPFAAHFPNGVEDYSSFLQMSSTFSSLILSALLQNPAAHAAASFAASFWPSPNMESSANSPAGNNNGGFPRPPMNPAPPPSMAAIAAATVAAATAWWAAHGLLPMCAPLHNGFTCPPPTAPFTNTSEAQGANQERVENNFQNHDSPQDDHHQPDQELSEALQPSKSSATSSSSDSGNSSGGKADTNVAVKSSEKESPPQVSDQEESSKGKSKKQVDRSSCGSNTPSGSDVETNGLEKNDEEKDDEPQEPDASHSAGEPSNRRNRIVSNINESWKAVSEEGRLAFQALFSREVLPQSFSPQKTMALCEQQMKTSAQENNTLNTDGNNEDVSQLDLNNTTWETCSCDHQNMERDRLGEDNEQDGLLTIGLAQGQLKASRTGTGGFKPYKRCSVEAQESSNRSVINTGNQDQEKCPKRLRVEGEAST